MNDYDARPDWYLKIPLWVRLPILLFVLWAGFVFFCMFVVLVGMAFWELVT